MGEWEIKNLSIQQIFDLIYYDIEQVELMNGRHPVKQAKTLSDLKNLQRRLNS